MTPPTPAEVLVVGAGPTGLLLGAELGRRGVDCLLIDSLDAPQHWDRATVLHPPTLELLEAIGLVDRFLEAGVPQRAVRLHSAGEVLGEMDLDTSGSPYGFNIGLSEEVTERLLAGHLHASGGSVVRSCRLLGLHAGEDVVTATVEQDGERRELTARWVVGCDGLHSPTRELSGIGFTGHDIPEPWAVFDTTLAGWAAELDVTFVFLEAVPVILTALPERRWRVYTRPSGPSADLVDEAAGVIGRYRPEASLAGVANAARFHCHTKVADRYRAGRVLLAGDAAHVCSPAEGHGMNSGLQDAFNLAWKLALVCRGEAEPALLDSYEAERRPVGVRITQSGDVAEQVQWPAGAAERAARDRDVRALLADPASRHQEVVAETELDVTYAASPIVAGPSDRHPAPGERLPDVAPVRAAGGGAQRRLAQLAHDSAHTVFVLGRDDGLERIARDLSAAVTGSPVFGAVVALSTAGDVPGPVGWLDPAVAAELEMGDVAVLAVRPDGHVGLRHDGPQAEPLLRYERRLRAAHAA